MRFIPKGVESALEKGGLIQSSPSDPPSSISQKDSRGEDQDQKPVIHSAVVAMLNQRRAEAAVSSGQLSATEVPHVVPSMSVKQLDPLIVDYFESVANKSSAPGYSEFLRQVSVLKKHIPDEASLYAAALESSGVTAQALVAAIDDRVTRVKNDKESSLAGLRKKEKDDLAASQQRVDELDGQVASLESQIQQLQSRAQALVSEKSECQSRLQTIHAASASDAESVTAAADSILEQLTAKRNKLQQLL